MNLRSLVLAVVLSLSLAGADAAQAFRLPNGLQVLLLENHERPLVRLELRTAVDGNDAPRGKEGITGFLGGLLGTCGVGSFKREDFQRFLENRGIRYTYKGERRALAWSVLADSQEQDSAFEGLSMAATRPVLDGNEVEAHRRKVLGMLRDRTPRAKAEEGFLRRLEGLDGPPDAARLGRITFEDLVRLARRVLRPERSVLVVYGDMNPSQARQAASLHFGAWGPGAERPLEPAPGVLPVPSPLVRAWAVQTSGDSVRVRVGTPPPASSAPSEACLWICARLVERELGHLPDAMAGAGFQLSSEGGWQMDLAGVPGQEAPAVLEAVKGLLAGLRDRRVGAGELASLWAARDAWTRSRSLHPQVLAAALADRSVKAQESSGERPGAGDLEACLKNLFAEESRLYFIEGPLPRQADWLARAGIGPVESVN